MSFEPYHKRIISQGTLLEFQMNTFEGEQSKVDFAIEGDNTCLLYQESIDKKLWKVGVWGSTNSDSIQAITYINFRVLQSLRFIQSITKVWKSSIYYVTKEGTHEKMMIEQGLAINGAKFSFYDLNTKILIGSIAVFTIDHQNQLTLKYLPSQVFDLINNRQEAFTFTTEDGSSFPNIAIAYTKSQYYVIQERSNIWGEPSMYLKLAFEYKQQILRQQEEN